MYYVLLTCCIQIYVIPADAVVLRPVVPYCIARFRMALHYTLCCPTTIVFVFDAGVCCCIVCDCRVR